MKDGARFSARPARSSPSELCYESRTHLEELHRLVTLQQEEDLSIRAMTLIHILPSTGMNPCMADLSNKSSYTIIGFCNVHFCNVGLFRILTDYAKKLQKMS